MSERLSKTQIEVMKWLAQGWSAYVHHDDVIYVNGQRLCTLVTMMALQQRGFVRPDGIEWKATKYGVQWWEDYG